MYLKWMDSRRGKICFDKAGLKSFVERNLCEGVSCRDVALLGEKNKIFVTLMKDDNEAIYFDRVSLSEDLTDRFGLLGVEAVVSWENMAEERPDSSVLTEKPYFWASLVAIVAALLKLGVKGSLLCLFYGALAYGAASFFQSDYGKGLLETIIETIREAMD